jgi:hypothetical protein
VRGATYIAVAIVLLLVQANLYRVFGPLGGVIGVRWLHGLTPDLVLPLVVFLAGAPIGLFTFVSVAVWWLSRIAGVRLTAQTWLTRVSLGFVFSVIEGALLLVLLAVFGSDNRRPIELASIVLPHACSTGLLSPLLFLLAQRLRQGLQSVHSPTEAAP